VDGIVFLVDSADFERFTESKAELDALLSIEELSKVPFLVLGNKIDAPGAVSEEELRHHLGLYQTTGKVSLVLADSETVTEVMTCSVSRARCLSRIFGLLRFSCARLYRGRVTVKACIFPVLTADSILTFCRLVRFPMGLTICKCSTAVAVPH